MQTDIKLDSIRHGNSWTIEVLDAFNWTNIRENAGKLLNFNGRRTYRRRHPYSSKFSHSNYDNYLKYQSNSLGPPRIFTDYGLHHNNTQWTTQYLSMDTPTASTEEKLVIEFGHHGSATKASSDLLLSSTNTGKDLYTDLFISSTNTNMNQYYSINSSDLIDEIDESLLDLSGPEYGGEMVAGLALVLLAIITAAGNSLVIHAIRTEKRLQTVSTSIFMCLAYNYKLIKNIKYA